MQDNKKKAIYFIVLMGLVSLFGDITYEGARSIIGPYLNTLGASAMMVGLIAGLGEFLGYALRLVSGYVSDRTGSYWFFTIFGYLLILSIPLLSLTGVWQVAAVFVVLERMGKAVRSPARDVLLSHATKQTGTGFGFGLHEAMDQIGALVGPLIFTFIFLLEGSSKESYSQGFSILWIPAILVVAIVIFARIKFPSPKTLEENAEKKYIKIVHQKGLPKAFWFYSVFIFLTVLGFANFQIISFHFKAKGVISDFQIPLFYAIAMAVDGVVALIIGKIYDKKGLLSLITIPLFTLLIPFFAFTNSYSMALISVVIWGIVMGIHETIMRAAIADFISIEKRGLAYGVFNTLYGLSWFIGSVAMGFIYENSVGAVPLIIFTAASQILAMPVFFMMKKRL